MYQLWDYFKNLLFSWGLYNKKGSLIFLGLDDAGKTTLLNLLKNNRFIQNQPTQHVTCEELTLGSLIFTTYDIGGHRQVRRVWKDYFPVADAIVFIIDASDRKRFAEAKTELDAIIEMELTSELPVLILGNKIDKYDSAGEEELKAYFNLNHKVTGKTNFKPDSRPLEVFMCSMACKEGYGVAFKWLSRFF